MTLTEQINEHIKEAMRAKDQARLRGLRAIKSAILNAETEKDAPAGPLTPERELTILQKLKKQRQDALEFYDKEGREDLAVKEREELSVIEAYMPAQLTDDELRTEIAALIAEAGATSPADLGKVMGPANARLKGRADGKKIAETVKALLAGGAAH